MEIECPTCNQRFQVDEDLKGKKVQCGACQHRFFIDDVEYSAEGKKLRQFPKENRDDRLGSFGRLTAGASGTPNFKEANYADVKAQNIGPVKPIYTMTMFAGVIIMLLVYGLFLLGRSTEFVQEMVQSKRFVLAGFGALVGGALIIFASVRKRALGSAVALFFGLGLLVIPIMFPYTGKSKRYVKKTAESKPAVQEAPQADTIADIKERVGYEPVQRAMERSVLDAAEGEDPKEKVVAVYLQLLQEEYKLQILDFIKAKAKLEFRPDFYVRGVNAQNWLMVIENGSLSMDEVAKLCERFGKVGKIHEDLRLIEVVVENLMLSGADSSELTDADDENFYFANKNELQSIDQSRVKDAIVRLTAAQPKEYRAPIVKSFTELMATSDVEMRNEIGKALQVWTLAEDDHAEQAVIDAMREMMASKKEVPASMIEYLVMRSRLEVLPLLFEYWEESPMAWEERMVDFGSKIETDVLSYVQDPNSVVERSALRVIRRIGTRASVPQLEGMLDNADGEILQLLRAALDSIRKRG